jgi:hypothetical protein
MACGLEWSHDGQTRTARPLTTDKELLAMYAGITIGRLLDPGDRAEVLSAIQELIDSCRDLRGYCGALVVTSQEGAVIGVTLWSSEEAARSLRQMPFFRTMGQHLRQFIAPEVRHIGELALLDIAQELPLL